MRQALLVRSEQAQVSDPPAGKADLRGRAVMTSWGLARLSLEPLSWVFLSSCLFETSAHS